MSIRYEHRDLVMACELDGAEAGDRAQEWQRLLADYGLGTEPAVGGLRLWVAAAGLAAVEDLVRREAQCCRFLDLEVSAQGDRVRVDITSPVAGADRVVASMMGLEDDSGRPCC